MPLNPPGPEWQRGEEYAPKVLHSLLNPGVLLALDRVFGREHFRRSVYGDEMRRRGLGHELRAAPVLHLESHSWWVQL